MEIIKSQPQVEVQSQSKIVFVPSSVDTPPQLGPAAAIVVDKGVGTEEALAKLKALVGS